MTRIRGDGPKAAQAQAADKAKATTGSKGAKEANFAALVQEAGSATDDKPRQRSALDEELERLAAEFAEGKATHADVSRQFVGAVIRDRYGKVGGKGSAQMEATLSELVEDDPQFAAKLQSQLRRLAKR